MKQLLILLLELCFLTACGAGAVLPPGGISAPEHPLPPAGVSPAPSAEEPADSSAPPDPIDALLTSMTLKEKVGQLFFVRYPGSGAEEALQEYALGGCLLFGRDFQDKTAQEVRDMTAACQAASAIPLLIGADEEGGTVVRLSSNQNLFPHPFLSPQALYAQGGLDALGRDAAEKSAGLLSYGVNVNFAPVADVSTDPSDFIYKRSLGQDAETTAAYIRTVVEAMSTAGIGSVLKHFPGYGDNEDTHTGVATDRRPYEQFQQEDFLPFQAGIDAGAGAVLVSHNIVVSMDPDLPASLSPEVHRVLREELGFQGVVLTDDLDMKAAAAYAGENSPAVQALLAGNDMVVLADFKREIPRVLSALADGTLTEERIDQSVRRVLQWKRDLGLLEAA